MNQMLTRLLVTGSAIVCVVSAHGTELPSYTLRDYLNRAWDSERVTYPVQADVAALLKRGIKLVDGTGVAVPWQLDADGKSVTFIVSVPAFGESTYRFERGAANVRTDLVVTETPETIELVNGRVGVRLNKALVGGAGPIAGWRLASGGWAGGSRFEAARKIISYKVTVEERGPVLATATARVSFEDGGTWSMTVTLQAGEPLFCVRESFECSPSAGRLVLDLNAGLKPTWMLYRAGGAFAYRGSTVGLGMLVAAPIPLGRSASLFLLEPWVHWQHSMNRGTCFTLLDPETEDAFFMGTSDAPCWVDPSIPRKARAPGTATIQCSEGGQITTTFEVKRGEREYCLGSLPSAAVMTDLRGGPPPETAVVEIDPFDLTEDSEPDDPFPVEVTKKLYLLDGVPKTRMSRAPLPQQFMIKHSDFPLNRIKDMVLEWDAKGKPVEHPRLLVSPAQLEAFRARYQTDEKLLARMRGPYANLNDKLAAYLASGDAQLEQLLVDDAITKLQNYTIGLLTLSGVNAGLGVAPHNSKNIVAVVNQIDTIASAKCLSDRQRLQIRAQLAFLGYVFNSPAYWSAPRGFDAMFVNMHTTVASFQCVIAGMLSDHPMCKDWMNRGMGYMRRELLSNWSDGEGRFRGNNVEAPHYAMSSYDDVLAATIMAERTGLGRDIYGPSMKQMGAWFAKISTPRDPRVLGWRHLPPIGNTYKFEPSGIFGILATVYSEQDPDFSAEMQWMEQQQGNPVAPGVGGACPSLEGFRRVLMNPALPARTPKWGSEWFRGTGAILRSSYATDDEMMLYMIAGAGASPVRHWDHDQGAITFWGRGNPISDDFGYTGCAPAEDQSLLTARSATGIMLVEALETDKVFDYLQGRQGGWLRQVMLVKHPSDMPKAPEYFVIHDSLASPESATWRLWLTAKPVQAGSGGALLIGEKPEDEFEEVDEAVSIQVGTRDVLVNGYSNRQSDVWFAQLPPGAAIKTELKTRSPYGVNSEGRFGKAPNSQVGLILQSKSFSSLLTLVFPRLSTDVPPRVTAIAGERGFRIEYGGGVDHVFLAEKPLVYEADGISFKGAVGVIRTAGRTVVCQTRPGVESP